MLSKFSVGSDVAITVFSSVHSTLPLTAAADPPVTAPNPRTSPEVPIIESVVF